MSKIKKLKDSFIVFLITALFITSCDLQSSNPNIAIMPTPDQLESLALPASAQTPLPTRTNYAPGELVDYTAQTGDTLPALAKRFNTSVDEILQANTQIPRDAPPCRRACP